MKLNEDSYMLAYYLHYKNEEGLMDSPEEILQALQEYEQKSKSSIDLLLVTEFEEYEDCIDREQ